MRYVTIDQVMRWRPCYTRDEVKYLFAGRKRINAADIAAMRRVSVCDKLWAVSHMLSPAQCTRIFAKRPDAFWTNRVIRRGYGYWSATDKDLVALRLAVKELMRND